MTDDARDRFAAWLTSDIRSALRPLGFLKSGSTFHLRGPSGWGVIEFQRSQFGSRHKVRFTINLGVTLDRLTSARGDDPGRRPPLRRCHWRARIAEAVGDSEDRWWSVDRRTDLAALKYEIQPLLLQRGVPLIVDRLSEDGFVAAMLRRPSVGQFASFTGAQVLDLLAPGRPDSTHVER